MISCLSRFPRAIALVVVVCCSVGSLPAQPKKTDPLTPEEQIRFAEGNYQRKFYDLAAKEYRYFVEKYPDNELAPHAMFRLIVCLRTLGRTDETFSAINQFQAKWPDHEATARLFLWKGEILFNQKRYSPAAACFKRLLLNEDSKTQETAQYFLAQCYGKEGKPDLALQAYAKLGAKPFDDEHIYRPYALFAVAVGHQQKNEFAEAAKLFQRLATEKSVPDPVREESMYRWAEYEFSKKNHAVAAKIYGDMLAKYPDGIFSREAGKRQVWAYYAMSKYPQAIELARAWFAKNGTDYDYEFEYVYGASLSGNENYAEALPVFQRIIKTAKTPEDYVQMARFQEIVCLLNLRRYDETIAAADGYVTAYPKAADAAAAYCFGGQACMAKKDYANAVTRLRKALDTAVGEWPYYEGTNLMLAEGLENLGRYAEAAVLQRKLAADKGIENPSYFLIKAGESHTKADDKAAAIADFEGVLKRFPKQDDAVKSAMFHLTQLYSEMKQYPRAQALVEQLLSRKDVGSRARLLSFLGYICYQQDKYADAKKSLLAALAEPDAGTVRANASFYLAASYLELKETDDALRVFREVLAIPEDQRPPFPEDLLFQLDKLYYARGQYAESEKIVRWLMLRKQGETVYRASLRLSDILAAQGKLSDARDMLEGLLKRLTAGELSFADPANAPMKEEVRAVLGEVYYHMGKNDLAVEAMESCLANKELGLGFKTRARWVLGEVLLKEGHPKQALPYAVKCFVLAVDPVYSPRGMHVAIRAFLAMNNQESALQTWRDLKKKYPAYAEQIRGEPDIAPLAAKDNEQTPGPAGGEGQ
jgi:tetratricopeptide (TPR) repeat protein